MFVGLGLYDCHDISLKGLEYVRRADRVYIEEYTSRLMGCTLEEMESRYGARIVRLGRREIEQEPWQLLSEAGSGTVVLLSAGDPMISTTHTDLRLRAYARGIETRIVHGASIASAVCGLTGLQNYRFGKSCSIPYPAPHWFPTTPLETILRNLSSGMHTLVYLDIQEGKYMTVNEGIELLGRMAEALHSALPPLFIGIARAGSVSPVVRAGPAERLREMDFGPPLHVLAVPAELHPVEKEYLEVFAGL